MDSIKFLFNHLASESFLRDGNVVAMEKFKNNN